MCFEGRNHSRERSEEATKGNSERERKGRLVCSVLILGKRERLAEENECKN